LLWKCHPDRQALCRVANGLALFELRENALRHDIVDGRVRLGRFDGRGYGRTDVMTYNCGSHVAPPVCNSVRACRLLVTDGRPVSVFVYFWRFR
jgi:hypothetical protein